MDYQGKKVLITGGSRGIGLAVANLLACKGADITILARDENRIAQALTEIRCSTSYPSQKITGISIDITDEQCVNEKLQVYMSENGAPDLLINSAGFAHPGIIEDLPMDIFKKTMDVNYFGTVNTVKALLPAMLDRGSGIIVNISSVSGFLGIYGYSAYSGSKFAVTGFTDALRNEMKPRGIQVSIVFPPDTDTEQLAYESQFKPDVTRKMSGVAGLATPDKVAEGIVKGMEKHQYVITPGFEPKVIYWLSHLLGKFTFVILDWMAVVAWKKTAANRHQKV